MPSNTEPTEKWRPYLCTVNDHLSSILVDLAWSDRAPQPERSWLLWVWLDMNAPRPDGLSSSDEAPLLYKIEDVLVPALAGTCGAVHVGRITTQGRREFYLYGRHADDLQTSVAEALAAFPEYHAQTGSKSDPEWRQYFDVLYPTPRQLESIKNADVLEALDRQGDVHSIPRPVDHFLYFDSEAQRSAFRIAAQDQGFTVIQEPESGGKFAINIERTQTVEPAVIDTTVLDLIDLAERYGGEYDGWGCVATNVNN